MKPKVCKCCGAPLHGYKCDYCGTEYERDMMPEPFIVERVPLGTDTIACKYNVDLGIINRMEKEDMEHYLKHKMAYEMSEKLLDYMDIETWIDPMTMTQWFGGRIKVLKPH